MYVERDLFAGKETNGRELTYGAFAFGGVLTYIQTALSVVYEALFR